MREMDRRIQVEISQVLRRIQGNTSGPLNLSFHCMVLTVPGLQSCTWIEDIQKRGNLIQRDIVRRQDVLHYVEIFPGGVIL